MEEKARTYVEPYVRDGNRVAGYWREVAPSAERWVEHDDSGGLRWSGTWFGGDQEFVYADDKPLFDSAGKVIWRALYYPKLDKFYGWFGASRGPFHGEVHNRLREEGVVANERRFHLSGSGERWSQDPGRQGGGYDAYVAEFTPELRKYTQEALHEGGTPEQKERLKEQIVDRIRLAIRRMKNDRDTVEILAGAHKSATWVKPYSRGGNMISGYWRELEPDSEEWRGPLFKGTWFGWDRSMIYADNEPYFLDDKLGWRGLYYPENDEMKFWIPSSYGPHHDEIRERAWRERRYDITEPMSYDVAGYGNVWEPDPKYEDEHVVSDFATQYADAQMPEAERYLDDDATDEERADLYKDLLKEGQDEIKRRINMHLRSHRREMNDIEILTGHKSAKEIMDILIPFEEDAHPRDEHGRFTDKPWAYALPPPSLRDFDGDREVWDIALHKWFQDTYPEHLSSDDPNPASPFTFELEGVDTELLYDIAVSLDRFSKDFPFVIDGKGAEFVENFSGDILPGEGRRPAFAGVQMTEMGRKDRTFASYDTHGDGRLMLNDKWWSEGQKDKLEEAMRESEKLGWFAPGTGNPSGVMNHELGHALSAYVGANHPDLWQNLEDSQWVGSVSTYARQDFLEFFAETFSSLLANNNSDTWDNEQRMLAGVLADMRAREEKKNERA